MIVAFNDWDLYKKLIKLTYMEYHFSYQMLNFLLNADQFVILTLILIYCGLDFKSKVVQKLIQQVS